MALSRWINAISIFAGVACAAWCAPPVDLGDLLTEDRLEPEGDYYESTVPDTLDLAERAGLAVRGLTEFLDPSLGCQHFSYGIFKVNPPYMSHEGDGGANWGKIAESLLMMRHMSGSRENLDVHTRMLRGMVDNIRPNGNYYVVLRGVSLDHGQDLIAIDSARVMMALMALNQIQPDARIQELIEKMARGLFDVVSYRDDYAYFTEAPSEPHDTMIGVLGFWKVAFIHGSALRGLARAYASSGDDEILELARKVKNYVTLPEYWVPETGPKAVVGHEHAQFAGHHHSYTAALMGLIRYAEVTGNVRLKQFVRDGYEYLRNFGIARIGLFGEMCTTGDMTYLALKLTELGVGDYWEDVDQYVRNQLVELQITDLDKLRRANALMPTQERVKYIHEMTTDRVIERNLGVWLSDASNPTLVREQTFRWTICCSGNCPPALYATWEAAVRFSGDTAQVNLLLNRASPWLDVDSYLPYDGKVVIRNKKARNVAVRIPLWVDMETVSSDVNGGTVSPYWLGRYLVFEGLADPDVITIRFPVVETTETYTLKWKEEDFWPESTDPGHEWHPHDEPDRFTLSLRGNTLVDISPRSENPGYRLYLREHLKRNQAPMKQVTRYVPPVVLKW